MTIEQAVIEKLRLLPVEKQREALDFVEFLYAKNTPRPPRRRLKGIWADLNVDITEEDIAEARREMWGNFPAERRNMKPSADIMVYSPDHQLQLTVGVMAKKGTTDEWVAKYRSKVVADGLIPHSRFFLFVLPEHLYLWRDNASTEPVPADYKVRAEEVLAPFVRTRRLEELSAESLTFPVSFWLTILINSIVTPDTVGPELQWVFDSGLYDAIKYGMVELEPAA